jgi:6-phosphogluconolactonase
VDAFTANGGIVIEVFADKDALSLAAAVLFARQAQKAIADHGRFSVLLAGGETPRRTYELLAREPLCRQIPWPQVHLFWGDERCVPADDPSSNVLMAHRAFIDSLQLNDRQLHPIRCERQPERAAADYEAELRRFFGEQPPRFDLVFLGLGEDGHTASLLPGSEALQEEIRWTAVTRRSHEPFSRITVTAPLINQAVLVVFLVTGRNKAKVFRSILEATSRTLYPAQLIMPQQGALHWWLDQEAAGEKRGDTVANG